jgi:endonuclease/exonuclease/phosphatase family metal-dependent hydrolase
MAKIENGKLTLKIASYNIAGGNYDKELSAIAEDIVNCGADIVGIQEVDMFADRSGNIDMLDIIAKKAGFEYKLFVKAINIRGGEYGTSIISKYPIVESEIIPLKSFEGGPRKIEDRSVGATVIDVLGEKINFLNTHLSFEFDDAIIYHFDQVAEILEKYDSYIITADYNTNNFSLFDKFHDSKIVNGSKKEIFSFPWSETTGSGIDNIVMSKEWSWKDADLGPRNHSDHRMLYATLEKEI